MKSNNLSKEDLQFKLGLSTEDFSRLLEGKLPVTEVLAYKLSYYLKTTLKYWLNKNVYTSIK